MEEILNFQAFNTKDEMITSGTLEFQTKEKTLILYYEKECKKVKIGSIFEYELKKDKQTLVLYLTDENIKLHINLNKDNEKEKILFDSIISSLNEIKEIKQKEIIKVEKSLKYIIKEPKDFQLEILEFTKKNNTIVFLETGLGKTYIAIMLLKEVFGEPLGCSFANKISYERKSSKKAMFLCKTIGLLIQQSKVIKYNTNLKIFKIYGGKDRISTPSYQKFRKNIERYDIIVGSAESIYRYFTLGYLTPEDFNILIFDECHHCKGEDPFNLLLKHFIFQAKQPPKILGLTASPSDDNKYNSKELIENIQALSNSMNSYVYVPKNILDMESINSKKKFVYVEHLQNENTNKKSLNLLVFNDFLYPVVAKYLEEGYSFKDKDCEFLFYTSLILICSTENKESQAEKLNWIFNKDDYLYLQNLYTNHSCIYFKSDNAEIFEKLFINEEKKNNFYGHNSIKIKNIYKNKFFEIIIKIAKFSALLLTYIDGKSLIDMIKTFAKEIILIDVTLKSFIHELIVKVENNNEIISYQSDILSQLLKCLSNVKINEGNKTIIFSKFRVTAYYLNKILSNNPDTNSTLIMGYNSKNFMSFSENELKTNLEKFKDPNSKCDILISTDVAEEGIDIKQCNNIIHLDKIETIKSYIQKNGRGRKLDSTIFLFVSKSEKTNYEIEIGGIEKGILTINEIIKKDSIKPKLKIEKYVKDFHYFETKSRARVYLSYAKKLVNEFIGKLEYDGYNWLREDFKIEIKSKKDGSIKSSKDAGEGLLYRPYLYLCSMVERINKIYDTEDFFNTRIEAEKYCNDHTDHFYLKAVKILHHHQYFNDNLLFNKINDDLLYMNSNQMRIPSEPEFRIKPDHTSDGDSYICHIYNMTPGFIDLNLNSPKFKDKYTAFISNFTTCNNFDIYITRNELKKLYFFNKTQSDFSGDNFFHDKPKLPFEYYNIININFQKPQILKIDKNDKDLIDFFYTYQMYLISDGECNFYFKIYQNKFSFTSLFKNQEKHLKTIFDHHKNNEIDSNLDFVFSNDIIKLVILKKENDVYKIHREYLNYILENVRKDIIYYCSFLNGLILKKENLQEKELIEISNGFIENVLPPFEINTLSRNLINFTKSFVLPHSSVKSIKGTFIKKRFNMSLHEFYLDKYRLVTLKDKDYIRSKLIDFNARIFKYKVNLTIKREFKSQFETKIIKKFNFLPNEILFPINYLSLDELFYFTMTPVLSYKIQNNIKYFYYAKCLADEYKIIQNNNIDIRLIMQALNSKTTFELQNYERLEFLGDSILKFLSSWEVFKLFPIGNKDLLSMKRRMIESNDNLFDKAFKKKLYFYLNTTQLSFKKIREKTEMKIFNVHNNRAFSKIVLKDKSTLTKIILNKIEENELDYCKKDKNNEYSESMENDKFAYNTYDEDQIEPVYQDKEVLYSYSLNDIREISNNIEITDTKQDRLLYKKGLADFVESLIGYIFITNTNYKDGLEQASNFLCQLDILQTKFDLDSDCKEFWLENLENKECTYNESSKKKYFENINFYSFKNKILMYQVMHHPTILTPDLAVLNTNYVNLSYQRPSFIGEAFISMVVSLWVYKQNPKLSVNESLLHKLKICGINHHIISLMSLDLNLDTALVCSNRYLKEDMKTYKVKINKLRNNWTNKKKIEIGDYEKLDLEFTIILCELFYAYWGAILLDNKKIIFTIDLFISFSQDYLLANATLENYQQHPKVVILELFFQRREILKEIKENGFNRLKFTKNSFKKEKSGKIKMFHYQLIINKFVIYEDDIVFNRAAITKAQTLALEVFNKICDEIDDRVKLNMQQNYLEIETILQYLDVPYNKET